jgi:hypothetical protein
MFLEFLHWMPTRDFPRTISVAQTMNWRSAWNWLMLRILDVLETLKKKKVFGE